MRRLRRSRGARDHANVWRRRWRLFNGWRRVVSHVSRAAAYQNVDRRRRRLDRRRSPSFNFRVSRARDGVKRLGGSSRAPRLDYAKSNRRAP